MTKDEERIVDANCSPHRLPKPGETPAQPQPGTIADDGHDAAAFDIGPTILHGDPDHSVPAEDLDTPIPYRVPGVTAPDPLREAMARALARRFRETIRRAWQAGVLDTYGPDDVCELLADEVAGMMTGETNQRKRG